MLDQFVQGWILREANDAVASDPLFSEIRRVPLRVSTKFLHVLLKSSQTTLEPHVISSEESSIFFKIKHKLEKQMFRR